MNNYKIIFFIVINFNILYSQNGEEVFSFLNVVTSARQASLGGNINSTWDSDSNISLWNPALMNEKMNNQLGLNYIAYLDDIKFGSSSWVYKVGKYDYLSFHTRYFDYGTFDLNNENGFNQGTFTAKDLALTLGYAKNISDFFTVGTNITYIDSSIETYQSTGISVDLGIVYHDIDYDTNVSLVVRNLGKQIKAYDSIKEKMPLQINLGISQKLENFPVELSLNLHDLQKFDISDPTNNNQEKTTFFRKIIDHTSVGAELFPDKGFNIRLGYNFKRANELAIQDIRAFSGLTYGIGFRIKSFTFDFAHANYLKNLGSNHFGLRINLESLFEKRYSWD